MLGALYIAQPPTGTTLKLGQTTQNVVARVNKLSGQALERFKLLRRFETEYPVEAEKIAFAWLLAQGFCRIGGAQREHFSAPLAILEEACRIGVAGAQAHPLPETCSEGAAALAVDFEQANRRLAYLPSNPGRKTVNIRSLVGKSNNVPQGTKSGPQLRD